MILRDLLLLRLLTTTIARIRVNLKYNLKEIMPLKIPGLLIRIDQIYNFIATAHDFIIILSIVRLAG